MEAYAPLSAPCFLQPSADLYVSNLPLEYGAQEIAFLFGWHGPISSLVVLQGRAFFSGHRKSVKTPLGGGHFERPNITLCFNRKYMGAEGARPNITLGAISSDQM
jgi:hypothetical protein